jgi:hypothetical protein
VKWQSKEAAIKNAEERTGEKFTLDACPYCGHSANLCDLQKDPNTWGGYQWEIVCSSSHCRARVCIVADGWSQQLDGVRNPHTSPENLYDDRVLELRRKWNRRSGNKFDKGAAVLSMMHHDFCSQCGYVGKSHQLPPGSKLRIAE